MLHVLAVMISMLVSAPFVLADEPGYIGVQIKLAEDNKGIEVVEAVADAPADKAGVKAGDVITKLNGKEVGDLNDFVQKVRDVKPGDTLTLAVTRDGKDMEIKVKVGKKDAE
jgi:S1-C subfamily serine protease